MKNIVIAGSTGYLGRHIVKELKACKVPFKTIARNERKLQDLALNSDQILKAEVTRPETLVGILEKSDILISTVGITRQKEGLSYMDVDYQANSNLLKEAKRAGVRKFIYVSAINGESMRELKIMAAKEKFVDELKASGLEHQVIRPNGFYSDMKDFLDMARSGRVYLFGDGEYKLNPIHGEDLAKFILENKDSVTCELSIGGPDIYTQNEIASLALQACNQREKILHLPDWIRTMTIGLMRIFTSSKTYGPYEFFLTMMAQDNIAPRTGIVRLANFFREEVDRMI